MPITTPLSRQAAATASRHPDAGVRSSQENADQVAPGGRPGPQKPVASSSRSWVLMPSWPAPQRRADRPAGQHQQQVDDHQLTAALGDGLLVTR